MCPNFWLVLYTFTAHIITRWLALVNDNSSSTNNLSSRIIIKDPDTQSCTGNSVYQSLSCYTLGMPNLVFSPCKDIWMGWYVDKGDPPSAKKVLLKSLYMIWVSVVTRLLWCFLMEIKLRSFYLYLYNNTNPAIFPLYLHQ